MAAVEAPVPSLASSLRARVGEPVALFCMRFAYRGIIAEVGKDFVRLAQAREIDHTGPHTADAPTREHVMVSDALVSLAVVELVFWPAWVAAGLDLPAGGARS